MYYVLKNDDIKKNCIDRIQSLDGVYRVTIEKYKKARTKAQNKLCHMWCEIIGNEFGYTEKQMFLILKAQFLGVEEVFLAGFKFVQPKESRNLPIKDFINFLDNIQSFAIQNNIKLPIPQQLYEEATT